MRFSPEPHVGALAGCLCGARFDLGLGQCAERVVDDHREQIAHAEGIALQLGLALELGGDDDRRRAAERFEGNAVMRTARSARPSIANRRHHNVVIGCNSFEQCSSRVL